VVPCSFSASELQIAESLSFLRHLLVEKDVDCHKDEIIGLINFLLLILFSFVNRLFEAVCFIIIFQNP
jgi:hypothetical protein